MPPGEAIGKSRTRVRTPGRQAAETALRARQRARQGDMLGSQYDARIVRDADGRVMDGREAFMAKLTAAEFAKRLHSSPDDVAHRVWAQFSAEADLSRPKGSNPRQRWQLRDALAKA